VRERLRSARMGVTCLRGRRCADDARVRRRVRRAHLAARVRRGLRGVLRRPCLGGSRVSRETERPPASAIRGATAARLRPDVMSIQRTRGLVGDARVTGLHESPALSPSDETGR
jgi:hypothetical protein